MSDRSILPPHIAWPLFVVGLLLLGVATTIGVLVASRSDGGPSIVNNYYQKAVAWDSVATVQEQSLALGWSVVVAVDAVDADGSRDVRITVADRAGQPVAVPNLHLTLERPQYADPVAELVLPKSDTPGTWAFRTDQLSRGLWDFAVTLQSDSQRFVAKVRKEVL